jgi:hypothetical protein
VVEGRSGLGAGRVHGGPPGRGHGGPGGQSLPGHVVPDQPGGRPLPDAHHTWAAHAIAAYLTAWSGDKTRALLGLTGSKYEQLTLATRKLTAGQLLKVLTRGVSESTAVYAANGTVLAVSGSKGLELVSNVGGVIRSLPVPDLNPRVGCTPARWWNSRFSGGPPTGPSPRWCPRTRPGKTTGS